MKISDTINRNGIDLLVLDFINNKPFVLAYNENICSIFDQYSNNYRESTLRYEIEKWLKKTKIKVVDRKVSLVSSDKSTTYGDITVKVSPLTLDEYKKYKTIIKPHIKRSFWLVTPNSGSSDIVCGVYSDGDADYYLYSGSRYCAPAFILNEDLHSNNALKNFSTQALIKELLSREIQY